MAQGAGRVVAATQTACGRLSGEVNSAPPCCASSTSLEKTLISRAWTAGKMRSTLSSLGEPPAAPGRREMRGLPWGRGRRRSGLRLAGRAAPWPASVCKLVDRRRQRLQSVLWLPGASRVTHRCLPQPPTVVAAAARTGGGPARTLCCCLPACCSTPLICSLPCLAGGVPGFRSRRPCKGAHPAAGCAAQAGCPCAVIVTMEKACTGGNRLIKAGGTGGNAWQSAGSSGSEGRAVRRSPPPPAASRAHPLHPSEIESGRVPGAGACLLVSNWRRSGARASVAELVCWCSRSQRSSSSAQRSWRPAPHQ